MLEVWVVQNQVLWKGLKGIKRKTEILGSVTLPWFGVTGTSPISGWDPPTPPQASPGRGDPGSPKAGPEPTAYVPQQPQTPYRGSLRPCSGKEGGLHRRPHRSLGGAGCSPGCRPGCT